MLLSIIELFIHIDQNLSIIIQQYGIWTYLFLIIIIFFETGFVVTLFFRETRCFLFRVRLSRSPILVVT